MSTNCAAICEHIGVHIEGLYIALEDVDDDDFVQAQYILGQIAQLESERELGYVPAECKPFIPSGGE